MDTSKENVKMCDCREIQRSWKPKVGDFYYAKANIPHKKRYLQEIEIVTVLGTDGKLMAIDTSNRWLHKVFEVDKSEHIWLPRQEDLQKMVKRRNMLELHIAFHKWLIQLKTIPYSMEQLWLAFVMQEKHSKQWDGDKWVKK